jgi:DMSO/TMAO reductase YedYZ molybdopterin-dependent catalytic subunit
VSLRSFRKDALAQTFPDSAVAPFAKFPYNSYLDDDPGMDLERWSLTVEGAVARPGRFTLAQIQALPKVSQNTLHVCIEGWSVVGSFAGARVADLLRLAGADPRAQFLAVACGDDYETSLDMASACHPQSLLCYEMYGRPLDRGHGAPLRLQMPTKLGYKQAKYLTRLEVKHVLPARLGTWEDRGYGWHGGL